MAAKSRSVRSSRCVVTTLPSALKIDPTRVLLLPFAQHRGYLFALQVFLCAAEIAGNDRERHRLGVARQVALAHIGERAYHHVPAVVGDELRRHRLQLRAEKEIEKKRRENVVAMVAQRDL